MTLPSSNLPSSNRDKWFVLFSLLLPFFSFFSLAFLLIKKNEGSLLMSGIYYDQKWVVNLCVTIGVKPNQEYFYFNGGILKNTETTTPLILACQGKRLGIAQLLVRDGARVNQLDHHGRTPLLASISNPYFLIPSPPESEFKLIRFLLRHGAKVNQSNNQGQTPMMVAVESGSLSIIHTLLRHGARVNQANNLGQTPMVLAAESGSLLAIHVLLRHHALLDVKDKTGKTPLMYAALGGHLKTVKFLLSRGIKVSTKDKNGNTAAALAENLNLERFLISQLPVRMRVSQNNYFFITLCKHANWILVDKMLRYGMNPNVKDPTTGMTPLFYAVQDDSFAVPTLLNHGAEVNVRDKLGRTPLMLASLYGNYFTVKDMVKRGARINWQDNLGRTALIYSITSARYVHLSPDPQITDYLVSKGAEVNLKTRNGRTALWYAEFESQSITDPGNEAVTQFERAKMRAVVQMLKQHGAHL